jgi:hypothetical protein
MVLQNSLFNDIRTYAEGPFAEVKNEPLLTLIRNTTIQNGENYNSVGFGGAIKVTSAGTLTLDSVYATET